MLLALGMLALLLLALAAVCLPPWRGATVTPERGAFDRAVYRDQLREVERDVARGVLNADEAGAARLEIHRRLLAVDATAASHDAGAGRNPRLAITAACVLVLAAGGLYAWFGAPFLPDVPFADQSAPAAERGMPGEHLDIKDAAARLRQKLTAEPTNAQGWALYARTEAMLGEWQQAVAAYRQAITLGQTGADVYAGYGEMLVLAADGIVPPAAHDAFRHALAAEPKNDVARYYLALADSQAGEVHRAIEAWQALAADLPEDSPMREAIAQRVAEAAQAGGIEAPALPQGRPAAASAPPTQAAPGGGPDAAQMAAAARMSPAEREEMVRGMVAQLAARMEKEPGNLEGWLRLGRAYAVLGETDKAVDAYDRAVALQPDDPSIKLQAVDALLGRLQPSDKLPPRAVALLHEAAKATPDAPEVLWYLGVVAVHDGHPDEARQAWTKLLAALPADSEEVPMVKAALAALKPQ